MYQLYKGLRYEIHVFQQLGREGWHGYMWHQVPVDLLISLNMYRRDQIPPLISVPYRNPVPDRGCDLLMECPDRGWTMVQCKNTSKPVTMRDLAGFWYMSSTRSHLPALIVTNRSILPWLRNDLHQHSRIQHRCMQLDHRMQDHRWTIDPSSM